MCYRLLYIYYLHFAKAVLHFEIHFHPPQSLVSSAQRLMWHVYQLAENSWSHTVFKHPIS